MAFLCVSQSQQGEFKNAVKNFLPNKLRGKNPVDFSLRFFYRVFGRFSA
jgi:hypothetical protein